MKILLIFAVLVVYTQARSEPLSIPNRIREAHLSCDQERKWDAVEIKKLLSKDILPVDNDNLNDYVFCYWKKIHAVDENGVIDVLRLKTMAPYFIRNKYPSLSENDAVELGDQALDDCKEKTAGTAKSIGQSCVLLRNCVVQYVKDRQD